jgi:hypothetical protein
MAEQAVAKEDPAATRALESALDRWFLEHGLPHFIPRYSIRVGGRVPVLLLLLFVVLAFELSIEPWLDLTVPVLMLAPAVVIVLTWWAAPVFAPLLGVHWQPRPGLLSVMFRLGTTLVALELLVLHLVPLDGVIDFVVMFLALWASALMYRPGLWAKCETGRHHPRAVTLGVVLVVGLLGFAFEGTALPDFDPGVDATAGAMLPGLRPLPQATPAIPVVVAIVALALSLARADYRSAPTVPTAPTAAFATLAPVLVFVLGGESTILAETFGQTWWRPVLALGVVGLAAAAAGLAHISTARPAMPPLPAVPSPASVRGTIREPTGAGLALWIASYALVFPIFFGIFGSTKLGGH